MDDELLMSVAGDYGTPVYVYDKSVIEERCRSFREAFSGLPWKTGFRYAFKANTNPEILGIIRREGFGADIVSIGELEAALAAGYEAKDIIYTSNSKSRKELSRALDAGVYITHGNMDECRLLEEIAAEKDVCVDVAFRVNPDVNPVTHPKIATGLAASKFGLHFAEDIAFNAFKTASLELEHINPVGMHCHIGSQIHDPSAFIDACGKMISFACRLESELDLRLEFIDFGGGLGVSYDGSPAMTAREFAGAYSEKIAEMEDSLSYRPTALFEPGRYLVAESGVLLTSVNSVKTTPEKKFVNVDCGFNALVRPAMYDAYHPIRAVGKSGVAEKADVAGNLCESGDILGRDRELPHLEEGDLLEIGFAGAYGYSMASNYNSKPRPAEILVEEGRHRLIREREGLEEIL